MALWITDGANKTIWHYGQPVPDIASRVVRFDADGNELHLILWALRKVSLPSCAKCGRSFTAPSEYRKRGSDHKPICRDERKCKQMAEQHG